MFRDEQNGWNLFFTLLFLILCYLGWFALSSRSSLPISVNLFDAVLITLATFRLIRLFVYDKIAQFLRDMFLDTTLVVNAATGITEGVARAKPARGPRRTLADLFSCPWCLGVWLAALVVFFYFLSPFAWLPIFLLAVAGLASLLQLAASAIGWRAEYLKKRTEQIE